MDVHINPHKLKQLCHKGRIWLRLWSLRSDVSVWNNWLPVSWYVYCLYFLCLVLVRCFKSVCVSNKTTMSALVSHLNVGLLDVLQIWLAASLDADKLWSVRATELLIYHSCVCVCVWVLMPSATCIVDVWRWCEATRLDLCRGLRVWSGLTKQTEGEGEDATGGPPDAPLAVVVTDEQRCTDACQVMHNQILISYQLLSYMHTL